MTSVKPQGTRKPQSALATPPPEDLSIIVQEARLRFMEAFDGQCEALAPATPQVAAPSVEEAVRVLHRMAGLGGTLGFPRVSARASAMEEQLVAEQRRPDDFTAQLAQLRAGYAQDVANSKADPPAAVTTTTAHALRVLIVEDEPFQRRVLSAQLRKTGHEPVEVESGEAVLDTVRAKTPDVVLLDVELPGIDGYDVCRMLKADPALAEMPVVFLSARADVESRLTGLSQGADEFLTKPVDPRELSLRLELLVKRRQRTEGQARPTAPAPRTAPLTPRAPRGEAATPETPICVLIGDDDPDVVRIVDAHLAAVGYRRILAHDGVQALAETRSRTPDIVVLDIMMPKLTGFDVLAGLRDMAGRRPKVLVLSARSRQEDVIRAFQLGADDFLVKPFNPQELLGRVARLVEMLA